MSVFGFGKKNVRAADWVQEQIEQLCAQEWEDWRLKKFQILDEKKDLSPICVDAENFNEMLLGSQLKLFEFLCVQSHFQIGSNINLGMAAVVQIGRCIQSKPADSWMVKIYEESSNLGAGGVVTGIYFDDACLTVIAGLLKIDKSDILIQELKKDFSNYMRQLAVQIRGINFT